MQGGVDKPLSATRRATGNKSAAPRATMATPPYTDPAAPVRSLADIALDPLRFVAKSRLLMLCLTALVVGGLIAPSIM